MEKEFIVSSQIYSLDAIQQALADFADISEIVYNNDTLIITGVSESEIQEVFQEYRLWR